MRALLLVALLAVPALAYQEADAPERWREQFGEPSAVAVGHAPQTVMQGDQFEGWIEMPANATADYQVCLVADACIIAQRPAQLVEGRWRFSTADFRNPLTDKPHLWRGGDTVGVQWFISLDGDEPKPFPEPYSEDDPRCDDFVACSASHYFTFIVEAAPASPALGVAFIVGLFLIARRW